jgi:hypothetical protein
MGGLVEDDHDDYYAEDEKMDAFRFSAYADTMPGASHFIFEVYVNSVVVILSVIDDRAGKMQRWLESAREGSTTLVIDYKDEYANVVCRKLFRNAKLSTMNQCLKWGDNTPAHFRAIFTFEEHERQEWPKNDET